ncbi:endonuclease-reverse transcriptase [Elysia marginata]|uniref:Endonuclease-reverse transcriptase n=1 Tax=Elysia marginata TaxID=1093978 RepID=A0AAV4GCW8_9GAST|nr:endonuclease-reverse transcriptase [Elysia marginata]
MPSRKKLRGDRGMNQEIPVKAEDGTTINDNKRKLERWKKHFEKIFNRFEPTFADIPEAEEDLENYMGNITVGEVKEAIQKLKYGKAPGDDGVCPEMLKAETEETPVILKDILQNIWAGSSERSRVGRYEKCICHHKKLRGDRGINHRFPVKAEDGSTITDGKKLERWKEHFENIFYRFEPTAFADIPDSEGDLEIYMGNKEAIQKLKCGKAPGDDGVCTEMLKAETEETPVILRDILQNICTEGNAPASWRKGTVINLPKKGDLGDCGNWRGIALLSLTSKIFCRIILKRTTSAVDKIIHEEQAGFRKGRLCIDHIFTLPQKATRFPDKASPTVDPSGTKKERAAEGDLEEDGGEGPERKRSFLRKRPDQDGELVNCLKFQTAQRGLSECKHRGVH